jgi:hypothetical protein
VTRRRRQTHSQTEATGSARRSHVRTSRHAGAFAVAPRQRGNDASEIHVRATAYGMSVSHVHHVGTASCTLSVKLDRATCLMRMYSSRVRSSNSQYTSPGHAMCGMCWRPVVLAELL